MTEVKYTPGPWKACKQFPHQSFIEIEHGDKHTPGAASLVIARVTCRPTWQEEQEANARLIASAPVMLKALKLIANAENSGLDLAYCKGIARAAIAKATGN